MKLKSLTFCGFILVLAASVTSSFADDAELITLSVKPSNGIVCTHHNLSISKGGKDVSSKNKFINSFSYSTDLFADKLSVQVSISCPGSPTFKIHAYDTGRDSGLHHEIDGVVESHTQVSDWEIEIEPFPFNWRGNQAPQINGYVLENNQDLISGTFISDASVPDGSSNTVSYKALLFNSKGNQVQVYDIPPTDLQQSNFYFNPILESNAYVQVQAYITGTTPTESNSLITQKAVLSSPSFDVVQYTNSESISVVKAHHINLPILLDSFSCKIQGSQTSICSTKVDESGNLVFSFTTEPTSTKKQLQVFGISDPTTALTSVDLTMPWVATFSLYDTTDKTKAYIRINIDSTEHNIDAEPFTCQLQDSNTKTASSGTNPNCAITSMGLFQLATVTGISPGTNQHVTISRAALKNTDTGAPYTQTQLVDLP